MMKPYKPSCDVYEASRLVNARVDGEWPALGGPGNSHTLHSYLALCVSLHLHVHLYL